MFISFEVVLQIRRVYINKNGLLWHSEVYIGLMFLMRGTVLMFENVSICISILSI